MSEPCPNVFPMIRYCATRVETLADALGQELLCTPADPFAEDLVLTRSGGIARWLTQRLSMRLGSSGHGDGVCARTRFLTFAQFEVLIRGGSDPWSSDSLVPEVMAAVDDVVDDKAFAQVRMYLGDPADRPRRRSGFARLTANRFSTYARWNMEMLRSWSQGSFIGPDQAPLESSQIWQAQLWNHVCVRMGSAPWEDATWLCAQAASSASQFARIAVFCPDVLYPLAERFLGAIDSVRPVLAYSQRCASTDESPERISQKLRRQLDFTASALDRLAPDVQTLQDPPGPRSLLGVLQHRLATGETTPVPCDDSIQIHSCYGDQQADILADQLVNLLAQDPSLEPRDILVLVHRMEDHRRLLEAFFRPDDSPDSDPRHRIRVSVSSHEPETATASDLLIFLMGLVEGRASSEDLLRMASFPLVMSHFGFSTSDLDKISTLISSSGIRWGLNPVHRAFQHMESFAQNTWMAGLGRMVLGVGLSEDDLAFKGTVLPLDAVDSDTVRLVEALGQIIAHVRMCCETWMTPAEPAGWIARFRESLDCLVGAWETTSIGDILIDFGSVSSPPLTLAEATSLFTRLREKHVWRSSFLNGDLGLAELGTMSLVPHKVVVVFGLDADSFPHQPTMDGDNLTGSTIEDPRCEDHQVFYDAVMAAREKFIAVYAGFDPATTAPTPMPAPLLDLVALCDPCSTESGLEQELIHVHSPVQTGALTHAQPHPGPVQVVTSPPTEIEIDDLCDVYANPAAYWLRKNAGLLPSVLKETEPIATDIPMALSPLDKWQIVTRMIRLVLAQKSPEAITQAELRRGTLPPGQVGVTLALDCLKQATSIVAKAEPILREPLSWRSISLGLDGVPDLVGQIPVRGGGILEILAGRVQPRQEIGAWAKILALQVAYPDQGWRAHLVGSRGMVTLTAPEPAHARRHLDYLRRVHLTGLASTLPLPPSASAHLATSMARNLGMNMVDVERRLGDTWDREPSWSLIWPTYHEMLAETPNADELPPDENFTSRFQALTHGVYVPMMRAGGVS